MALPADPRTPTATSRSNLPAHNHANNRAVSGARGLAPLRVVATRVETTSAGILLSLMDIYFLAPVGTFEIYDHLKHYTGHA
jgi:hypothetical protein